MIDDVDEPEVLQESAHRRIERVGDTVRRPVQPWTPTIHLLLDHLRSVGFDLAPRPLGIDEHGREILEFIDGESGHAGWKRVTDEEGLRSFASLLRDYHQASAEFSPPPDAPWALATGAPADGEVVLHGDLGPWNVVWRDGQPVGIIDWDYAGPGPAVVDVAWALQFTAPFRDDEECLRWLAYTEVPDRRRRIDLFCAAYGIGTDGIVDAVIEAQHGDIRAVRTLAEQGRQPQADWVRDGELEKLQRHIDWCVAHRHLFEGNT